LEQEQQGNAKHVRYEKKKQLGLIDSQGRVWRKIDRRPLMAKKERKEKFQRTEAVFYACEWRLLASWLSARGDFFSGLVGFWKHYTALDQAVHRYFGALARRESLFPWEGFFACTGQ
jgi:hypothetical protein